MMIKRFFICLLSISLCFALAGCNYLSQRTLVAVFETTGTKGKLLERQSDLEWKKAGGTSMNSKITINMNGKKQDFLGLGASLTHASAYLLMQTDATTRSEILREFFGSDGAYYNYIRLPIGASDYTPGDGEDDFFTCDDLSDPSATDLTLQHFSLERDADIIAVLKELKDLNPNLTYIAVPWSAPAWMKTNNNLMGGALKAEYIDVYADYFVKFIQGYKDLAGIEITALSLVNEPYVGNIKYPHMYIEMEDAKDLTITLGKKLSAAKFKNTKILAYEHNYSSADSISAKLYIDAVLSDKKARKYSEGVAFHGYGNEGWDDFIGGLAYVKDNYKKMNLYMTEITEHGESVDFASNLSYAMQNVLLNSINNGLNVAMYWNFVLTSEGKPVNGNNSVCFGLISLDKQANDEFIYKKNAAYYGMAHISKFVYKTKNKQPKVLSLENSNPGTVVASAFHRADNKLVIVAHNISDVLDINVDFVVGNKVVTVNIAPQGVVTLVA